MLVDILCSFLYVNLKVCYYDLCFECKFKKKFFKYINFVYYNLLIR